MPAPYLHFQGRCAEALTFYAEVFGAPPPMLMRYADSPDAPEAWRGTPHVMHGDVHLPDGPLMASDFPPGMEGDPQKAVSVMQALPDRAAVQAVFDRLSEGGDVVQPVQETFFAPAFAMLRDRFGTHWILMAPPRAAPGTAQPVEAGAGP